MQIILIQYYDTASESSVLDVQAPQALARLAWARPFCEIKVLVRLQLVLLAHTLDSDVGEARPDLWLARLEHALLAYAYAYHIQFQRYNNLIHSIHNIYLMIVVGYYLQSS